MIIDEIISELQCVNVEIPEEALRMAIQEKDLITPRLLREIEIVKNNIKEYADTQTILCISLGCIF